MNRRIDRVFPGVGRICISSGTTKAKLFDRLDSMLTDLHEHGYIDVLKAIQSGRLTLQEVYQAKRAERLSYVLADMLLDRPLQQSVDDWLPVSARATSSRDRYRVSWNALLERTDLPGGALVSDLAGVDWRALHEDWPNSEADWNRMRAAVSRFLTMHLEDKHHRFRREIMREIPRGREPRGRVPDITPVLFWRLLDHVREDARPALIVLAATGLRIRSEYLRLERHHLLPHTRAIQVPEGGKTEGSSAIVRVGEETWRWVCKAVPEDLSYMQLYRTFKAAAAAVGQPELTPHDLRHLTGMLLSDAGVPEARIQSAMRHLNPSMTRRYTMQRDRGEVAATIDDVLYGEAS